MSQLDLHAHAASLLSRLPAPGVTPAALAGVLAEGQVLRHASGKELCVEGAPSLSLWFLLAGQVTVHRADPSGQVRLLATIRAPAMVGHMGLVDREKRSATVIADTPITVAELDNRAFDRLSGDASDAGFALRQLVLASLTRQLAAANQRLSRAPAVEPGPRPSAPSPGGQLDLLGASDILEGWDLDAPELDELELVQLR